MLSELVIMSVTGTFDTGDDFIRYGSGVDDNRLASKEYLVDRSIYLGGIGCCLSPCGIVAALPKLEERIHELLGLTGRIVTPVDALDH